MRDICRMRVKCVNMRHVCQYALYSNVPRLRQIHHGSSIQYGKLNRKKNFFLVESNVVSKILISNIMADNLIDFTAGSIGK